MTEEADLWQRAWDALEDLSFQAECIPRRLVRGEMTPEQALMSLRDIATDARALATRLAGGEGGQP